MRTTETDRQVMSAIKSTGKNNPTSVTWIQTRTGIGIDAIEQSLSRLTQAGLVTVLVPGRYTLNSSAVLNEAIQHVFEFLTANPNVSMFPIREGVALPHSDITAAIGILKARNGVLVSENGDKKYYTVRPGYELPNTKHRVEHTIAARRTPFQMKPLSTANYLPIDQTTLRAIGRR